MIKTTAFLYSQCFQYILRKKKLTFWEICNGVNFICFPEMMRNSIFDLENGGSTYTRVNTVLSLFRNFLQLLQF